VTIALLGTGIMGAGMARNIAGAGLPLVVWNRSRDKAEALSDVATVAGTVAEAVEGADVVVTMLYDADSVLGIVDEVVAGLGPDAVWLQCSTVGPAGIARIAEAAGPVGDRLLDAPVLGTRQPAETGNLTVLVSGPGSAVDRAKPALDAVGARTMRVGDRVGPASALKLANRPWVWRRPSAWSPGCSWRPSRAAPRTRPSRR
jgi:3-hydroxyisobutyrate dehydrogenase